MSLIIPCVHTGLGPFLESPGVPNGEYTRDCFCLFVCLFNSCVLDWRISRISRWRLDRRLFQKLCTRLGPSPGSPDGVPDGDYTRDYFIFLIAVIRLEPFLESPEGVSEVDLIPHTVLIVM